MADSEIPVIVVFGPTASGKTDFAAALFARDGVGRPFAGRAEIVSADSMQVYRGLDIGTAKPDAAFRARLPHHLLDIRDPAEQFCAGDFVRLADEACADIHGRGKLPVILGGTAFYIRNFIYGLPVTPESDPETRSRLMARMVSEGALRLHSELATVDPESARRIHVHDEYRILRALEIYEASRRPLSDFRLSREPRGGYRFFPIALDRSRLSLSERINRRVDAMFEAGLAEEFRGLVNEGYRASDPGMQAIGYREFFASDDLLAVRLAIQNDSRKYAKRQETFIRSLSIVRHFDADDFSGIESAISAFVGSPEFHGT